MPSKAYHCAVLECNNGGYQLAKWQKELCQTCSVPRTSDECKCPPPFRLFPFPTKHYDVKSRGTWKVFVNRSDKGKLFSPSKDMRVCSKHFVDGKPTPSNPYPTKEMGYDCKQKVSRKLLSDASAVMSTPKRRKTNTVVDCISPVPSVVVANFIPPNEADEETRCNEADEETRCDGDSCDSPTLDPPVQQMTASTPNSLLIWLIAMAITILSLHICAGFYFRKSKLLQAQVKKLKAELKTAKDHYHDYRAARSPVAKLLKTDRDVEFYSGIQSKELFNTLLREISKFVSRFWRGTSSLKKNIRVCHDKTVKFGPKRLLSLSEEFLLTLMKLRLGLLNKDLADRFNISTTLCSRIFKTWIRAASTVLKNMVYMLNEEEVISTSPQRFRHLPGLHSIIDCTEIFIQTPKDPRLQTSTWSSYKHHNTLKILLSIAPNSFVMFASRAYPGRMSDKALTIDSKFLEMVPPRAMIMADKGFSIANECSELSLTLYVPPGKRGQTQMTSAAVTKTKRIANLRILVEQVISQLKCFRLIKHELPLSLVSHIDDIVMVCCALLNFRSPIYKT